MDEPSSMTNACLHQLDLYFRSDKDVMSGAKRGATRMVRAVLDSAQWEDAGPEADLSRSAFDRWLNEKLRIIYGPVLQEPIPEQLAELIEAHRRRQEES
jgi:hypothetical protein